MTHTTTDTNTTNDPAVICICDEGMHARGIARCVYTTAGALRPEYRERTISGAPRMSAAMRTRLAERSRSYSNAVRNYNR